MHERAIKRGDTTQGWDVTFIYLDKQMFRTEHKCNGMELVYKYDQQGPILAGSGPILVVNTPRQGLQARVEVPADWK